MVAVVTLEVFELIMKDGGVAMLLVYELGECLLYELSVVGLLVSRQGFY